MESWRKVWRRGIARQLSTPGLEALRLALLEDDPRLVQGVTTHPSHLTVVHNSLVEAACVIGYAAWKGDGKETVAEAEESFAQVCYRADLILRWPYHCRHFLSWYDDTPRDEMRRLLLPEVSREIARRGASAEG